MQYRRSDTKGGTYFFTINLADRSSALLIKNIEHLRRALRKTKAAHPFDIVAMVVMPDHMHLLIKLPEDDHDYPLRVRLIKTYFSKSLAKIEFINSARESKGERGIWQHRYWEY
jgi:putative transposase